MLAEDIGPAAVSHDGKTIAIQGLWGFRTIDLICRESQSKLFSISSEAYMMDLEFAPKDDVLLGYSILGEDRALDAANALRWWAAPRE